MSANERLFTKDEERWCRRLKRVFKDRPRTLEVHVGLGSIEILAEGGMERCFDDSFNGCLDNIGDYVGFSIQTDITGDGSGL